MFCTDLTTNSDFCFNNLSRLVCITEVESVYCAVRNESLYKTDTLCLPDILVLLVVVTLLVEWMEITFSTIVLLE
jgi:hypothetical protein